MWGKHSTFERALNSLLIVRTPELEKPGIPTNGLVASIDLYPTLCELTKLPLPDGLDGESFAKLVRDPDQSGKDFVASFWNDIISLRTDRYRMALFHNDQKEEIMLFDHQTDPDETTNIASQHPDVIGRLKAMAKEANHGFLPRFQTQSTAH
ncbi:sulfatase/phosphatase domain-containing protein [Luteolibacter algae]|uniref:Sulfatase/phosphatase domain-containing protein n=1 Tax=Luteolibacter algae TaxID=454151 RepID=A0ABW5D404_9BACT